MFAECTKEDLAWFLSFEAKEKAKSLGLERGGIIIALEARSYETEEWLGTKDRFITAYPFTDSNDENNVIFQIPDDQLDRMIDSATYTIHLAPFDDYRFFSSNYGTSFCYEICTQLPYEIPIAATALYVTVIPCGSNSGDERAICLHLHRALEEWCKANNKSIPELDLR